MTYCELKSYPEADEEQRRRIDGFIENIADPQTRAMFMLHFVAGLSYKQTAEKLGAGMSRDCVFMRIKRYMNGR